MQFSSNPEDECPSFATPAVQRTLACVQTPALPPKPAEPINRKLNEEIDRALAGIRFEMEDAPELVRGMFERYSAQEPFTACPKLLEIICAMFMEKPRSKVRRQALVAIATVIKEECTTFSGLKELETAGVLDAMDQVVKLNLWPEYWETSPTDLPDTLILQSHYSQCAKKNSPWLLDKPEFCTIGIVLQHCQRLIQSDSSASTKIRKYSFVHLGSGNGDFTLTVSSILCSNSYPGLRSIVHKLIGVENNAQYIHSSNLNLIQYLHSNQEHPPPHALQFLKSDFCTPSRGKGDWDSTPVILFVNATSFSAKAMTDLAARVESIPKGSRVISVSRPVPNAGVYAMDKLRWKHEWQVEYPMSWGVATIYIHARV